MSANSERKRKTRNKPPKPPRFSDKEIESIDLIPWLNREEETKLQQTLFWDCWKQHRHQIIFEMLSLYKSKCEKFWLQNMRRALHTFKPPTFDILVWCKFHELFKANVNQSDYAQASALIFPVLAQSNEYSLLSLYKAFKKSIKSLENGPSLRSISALLEVCCQNIENNEKNKECVEIGFDLYKISKDFNIDLSITTSTDFFDFLFRIFAVCEDENKMNDFNDLFDELSKNVNNKVAVDSTKNAIKSFFESNSTKNIQIFDNLRADLKGFLYFENGQKMKEMKLPKFRLSVTENSEIWEQLRLTQMSDASHLAFESALFCGADNEIVCDEEKEKNNRRKFKYDQFIKYMLKDGGAEVIIDGANIGHLMKQGCFCFDFVDNVASYYAKNGKKVRIIMAIYRIYNAQNCGNEQINCVIAKWQKNKWLITVPNMLYDDVLWSIYALHSCLIYDENVIILSNDQMRDHSMALNYKRRFSEFLETKLCRIEVLKEKKQRMDIVNTSNQQKYDYIHTVHPYNIHPPSTFVIKPQFYKTTDEFVWFVPYMAESTDCKNQLNVLKQCYTESILQKRVKWLVARLKR